MRDKALQIALSQLGVSEHPKGSNWGLEVKSYLNSVGITTPAPWCMAFVYWCVDKACKELDRANPLYQTGGVLLQYARRKELSVLVPQPGDIFIMSFRYGKGHTGFVERVEGVNFYSIEGNSNDDGSREGYEVCKHKRPIQSMLAFLRYGSK